LAKDEVVKDMVYNSEVESKIIKILKQDKSVVLIGPSDSGKTFFVKNKLIPKLEMEGYRVVYFEDGNCIEEKDCDFVFFDEAETLIDQKIIENKESQLYSEKYLQKVQNWTNKYSVFTQPAVFIISRDKEDIEFLLDNLKEVGGKKCDCLEWKDFKPSF